MIIRIGTRASPLALKQTQLVIDALVKKEIAQSQDFQIVPMKTTGDLIHHCSLADIGGKSLFTKEIQTALLNNQIDFAVHSLKDMECLLPSSLEIGAVLPRESPWDVWISRKGGSLASMPLGAVVGTCSPRRAVQVKCLRPDVIIKPIRGNIETRLNKMDSGLYDGVILAHAGMKRLQLEDPRMYLFSIKEMVPAACQGVIAMEYRREDQGIRKILATINHIETHMRMVAERTVLKVLKGTCRTPVGVFASPLSPQGHLLLTCLLANEEGTRIVHFEAEGSDPLSLGEYVAQQVIGKLNTLEKRPFIKN